MTELTTRFQWRDKQGNFWNVEDMETRHLFFTLRMIWNHSAPSEYRIHPYKPYNFSSFYTEEYICQAVKAISVELSKRDDLKPYFERCLNHMVDSLKQLKTRGHWLKDV